MIVQPLTEHPIEEAPQDKTIIYVWNKQHGPTLAAWWYPREEKKHPERGQWIYVHGECLPLEWVPKYWCSTAEYAQ